MNQIRTDIVLEFEVYTNSQTLTESTIEANNQLDALMHLIMYGLGRINHRTFDIELDKNLIENINEIIRLKDNIYLK